MDIMKTVTELPTDYEVRDTVEMSNKRLMFLLTILGIVAFFLFGLLFLFVASRLSSPLSGNGSIKIGLIQLLEILVLIFTVTFGVLIVHELVHALFFWLFTKKWPIFGFKGFYAYAAAPGWYIPRLQFILIGLAPLVLITLCGLVLLPFISFPTALIIVLALTMNAAGSIGDLYIVVWLLTKPASILIRDYGTGMTTYGLLPK